MANNNHNDRRAMNCQRAKTSQKQCCIFLPLAAMVVVVFNGSLAPSVQCQSLMAPSGILMMPPPQLQPQPPPQVLVAGNAGLLRESERVDQIIWPNDKFTLQQLGDSGGGGSSQASSISGNGSMIDLRGISYVIDHKRFVESVTSRCFASTILEDPDSVEPSFVFIKRKSEVRLNATAPKEALIRLAGFEPDKPTVVIVHGFTQSYPNTDWLRKARALFEMNHALGSFNLIFMDWGSASKGSYGQVAAMTSGMGSFLANMLMKLFELGADRKAVHIIGHSLGAHLAGFAAKRLRPRIGRITALDPAGPCFGKLFSNSPEDRLTPDDAIEVAVYHYDDAFLGLPGQHGHFDVLVNGGSSQPGAKDNLNSMFSAVVTMVLRRNRVLSESHTRSTEVHTAQLAQTNCQQVAYECRDWPAFLSGECGKCDDQNQQCFFMGFPFQYQPAGVITKDQDTGLLLPPAPGAASMSGVHLRTAPYPGKRLYVATSGKDTFCLQHYQILVKLEPQQEIVQQARRNGWRFYLELINERHERLNITLNNQLAPAVFSYLLLSETTPARFTSALLQVRQSTDNSVVDLTGGQKKQASNKQRHLSRINNIEINFMSHENPNVRRSLSSVLCPSAWLAPPVSSSQFQFNLIADSSPNDHHQTDWLALEQCNPIN